MTHRRHGCEMDVDISSGLIEVTDIANREERRSLFSGSCLGILNSLPIYTPVSGVQPGRNSWKEDYLASYKEPNFAERVLPYEFERHPPAQKSRKIILYSRRTDEPTW